jgi:hypothetical protein
MSLNYPGSLFEEAGHALTESSPGKFVYQDHYHRLKRLRDSCNLETKIPTEVISEIITVDIKQWHF